ncbi:YMGG-like glycine zipper-containing protein [Spirosoma areae]
MKTIHSFVMLLTLSALIVALSVDAQAQKRWKPQTKGAVIGGAAGGAAGAIINKRNRVVGGLIGAAAGAGAGYAIGKGKDNRNKAAARVAAAEAETARAREAAQRAEQERDEAVAKEAVVKATAAPKHGFGVAARPAQVATTARAAVPEPAPLNVMSSTYALTAAFLPNSSFGDPNSPYASSEYRRKSW